MCGGETFSDRCILKHLYTADFVYYHYENGSKQAANLISGGKVGFRDNHQQFFKEQFRKTVQGKHPSLIVRDKLSHMHASAHNHICLGV